MSSDMTFPSFGRLLPGCVKNDGMFVSRLDPMYVVAPKTAPLNMKVETQRQSWSDFVFSHAQKIAVCLARRRETEVPPTLTKGQKAKLPKGTRLQEKPYVFKSYGTIRISATACAIPFQSLRPTKPSALCSIPFHCQLPLHLIAWGLNRCLKLLCLLQVVSQPRLPQT